LEAQGLLQANLDEELENVCFFDGPHLNFPKSAVGFEKLCYVLQQDRFNSAFSWAWGRKEWQILTDLLVGRCRS
jgi:hypothetical protein